MTLTQDPIIPSQQFCCISYVLPKSDTNDNDTSKITAIKIRGSYPTLQEAKDAAAELQKIDPYFHIFVGQVGLWLPLDGDIDNIKEQIYFEKPINELINGEIQRANEAKLLHEQRMMDIANEAQKQKSHTEEILNKKTKTIEQIQQEEQEEKVKFEKLQEELKQKENKLSDFEKKLDEIMRLQKNIKSNK